MGRPPRPEIRERLLDAATDHALEHGLPDGLEPLAAATGASSRMLLYHFGTRDLLLRAVLERARARQREEWEALLAPRPGTPWPRVLEHAWGVMSGPAGAAYRRMFGGLREDAEQRLWPGFRERATTDWLAPLERGLGSRGSPASATLVLAVVRGLLLDLEATGDRERVDAAFRRFTAGLGDDGSAAG